MSDKVVWTEQQLRLLRAAQDLLGNASEHEESRDGEPITVVFPDDFTALRLVVQEISNEAAAEIREEAKAYREEKLKQSLVGICDTTGCLSQRLAGYSHCALHQSERFRQDT